MAEELVLAERDGAVLVLTLNRPDRLNAMTPAMTTRYFNLLEEAERDEAVRVIVLTGAGRGFCSGADFQVLKEIQDNTLEAERDDRPNTFATTIRKPVIAAINGACAGLGFVHAIMCDLIFAADSAKFTTAFSRRGLIAEYGTSWVLPRLIGQARAMDLLLSGRTFTGAEAYELGLVNRVVPLPSLMDSTLAYAHELAIHASPSSMAVIKRQVWRDWTTTLEDSSSSATRLMIESFGRADFKEGTLSFLERREPQFPPLSGAGEPQSPARPQ